MGIQVTISANQIDKQRLGYCGVSLTHFADTAEPSIAAGSKVEVGGALYEFTADETGTGWAGIGASNTVYILITPSGATCAWSYTTTLPTWDVAKQGWYTGGNRVIASLYKDASSNYFSKRMMLNNIPMLGLPSFVLETIKLLRGTIAGLTISNNSGDATNDIDIAAGWCLADGAIDVIALGSTLTKRKDVAWVVGTGNGGMDTGSAPADGFMYLWLIKRADTGVVDALFSISATSPTMPANYTLKRRIGAVRTTSSAILAFEQNGDDFRFKAISVAFNYAVVGSTARQLLTVKVPPNMIGRFNVTAGYSVAGPGFAWAGSTGFTDVAPATYYNSTMIAYLAGDETMEQEIPVDGSSQIAFRVNNATNSLFGCQVLGWIDKRGKEEAA